MQNIIKTTCKELNLTYKQLGELIGYSESAVRTIASNGKLSESLIKSIELLRKNHELETKLADMQALKNTLKSLLDLK